MSMHSCALKPSAKTELSRSFAVYHFLPNLGLFPTSDRFFVQKCANARPKIKVSVLQNETLICIDLKLAFSHSIGQYYLFNTKSET